MNRMGRKPAHPTGLHGKTDVVSKADNAATPSSRLEDSYGGRNGEIWPQLNTGAR